MITKDITTSLQTSTITHDNACFEMMVKLYDEACWWYNGIKVEYDTWLEYYVIYYLDLIFVAYIYFLCIKCSKYKRTLYSPFVCQKVCNKFARAKKCQLYGLKLTIIFRKLTIEMHILYLETYVQNIIWIYCNIWS